MYYESDSDWMRRNIDGSDVSMKRGRWSLHLRKEGWLEGAKVTINGGGEGGMGGGERVIRVVGAKEEEDKQDDAQDQESDYVCKGE